MPCSTGKKQYLTAGLAEDALIAARTDHGSETSGPVGVYQCEDCGQWHLTSKGTMNARLAEFIQSGKLKLHQQAEHWKHKLG